jgi:hypothetical protein
LLLCGVRRLKQASGVAGNVLRWEYKGIGGGGGQRCQVHTSE